MKSLWSHLLVIVAAVLVYRLHIWHWGTRAVSLDTQRLLILAESRNHSEPFASWSHDLFNDNPITDDSKRDATCAQYLVKFLNGTTDANDECQGFMNAWKAADCKDDTNLNSAQIVWYDFLHFIGLGKRHKLDNGTIVDDDVLIDDYYENWECCNSIEDFYEKHCEAAELDAFKMLGIFAVLVACGCVKSLLRVTGLHWIPDAGACILVGSVMGGILRLFNKEFVNGLNFDNDLFLQILLPPIIFEAALTIDKRAFRRDLFPILTLAIFGTGFSALAIGYITHHMTNWGSRPGLPFLDSMLFGALMSSIDPVATLSILSGVGVGQSDTLYTLIFGESLLNDGVSIVLFNSLVQHMGDADVVSAVSVHSTLMDFVVVISASIAIGLFSGAICTFYFWSLQRKHTPVTEVAMFFTWALVPYYIADGFGFSGIISIMVMGFMLDYFVLGGFESEEADWMEYMSRRTQYFSETRFGRFRKVCAHAFSGRSHLDNKSRTHVEFVAEVISNLMETVRRLTGFFLPSHTGQAIFAYLGLFLFNDKSFNLKYLFSGLFSCVASRAVMIVGACLLINIGVFVDLESVLCKIWNRLSGATNRIDVDDDEWIGERVYLDKKTQLILFSAGIRGAVSYALVQNIPVYDTVTKHGSLFKSEMRAMTSTTIVMLLFCFGALTYFTVQGGGAGQQDGQNSSNLTDRLLNSGLMSEMNGGGMNGTLNGENMQDLHDNSLELQEETHQQSIPPPNHQLREKLQQQLLLFNNS